jgi:hypothetical protein
VLFRSPCLKSYGDDGLLNQNDHSLYLSAPLFQQAFRWFREKYDIIHNVDRIFQDEFGYTITSDDNEPINGFCFNTYEEAELACLDKLIEIVESKNK